MVDLLRALAQQENQSLFLIGVDIKISYQKKNTVYLEGELKNVHESNANKFLLKEGKWFTVDYSKHAQKIYDVHKNYKKYLKQSAGLKTNINKNFTLDKMTTKLGEILNKYVKDSTKNVELKLPTIKKL